MDLRNTLAWARDLLTPSGEIAVVGLWANESAWDWVWSACCLPVAMVGDRLHGETPGAARVTPDNPPYDRRSPAGSGDSTQALLPLPASVVELAGHPSTRPSDRSLGLTRV
jgi:hypothetical protein